MRIRGLSLLLVAPALMAQSQPTFYAAFQDGQEAERQEHWAAAIAAYSRAIALRPASAARVIIYGNNLLTGYYPYTRLARCELELGHAQAAGAWLERAAAQGEPLAERTSLRARLEQLRPEPTPGEAPPRRPAGGTPGPDPGRRRGSTPAGDPGHRGSTAPIHGAAAARGPHSSNPGPPASTGCPQRAGWSPPGGA
ncbi:MAG: hypothetical protein KGI56_04365, partial [Acidobacteriota bacterium]|nr:hypothetical protein [Acidobacteriota bacterium]